MSFEVTVTSIIIIVILGSFSLIIPKNIIHKFGVHSWNEYQDTVKHGLTMFSGHTIYRECSLCLRAQYGKMVASYDYCGPEWNGKEFNRDLSNVVEVV